MTQSILDLQMKSKMGQITSIGEEQGADYMCDTCRSVKSLLYLMMESLSTIKREHCPFPIHVSPWISTPANSFHIPQHFQTKFQATSDHQKLY